MQAELSFSALVFLFLAYPLPYTHPTGNYGNPPLLKTYLSTTD